MATKIEKEENRKRLEIISFHLDQAMRFCGKLDLSGLGSLEQKEWNYRIKNCRDAIEFIRGVIQQLSKILAGIGA